MNNAHNHEMNLAWRLVANTNTSVFLTGKAGTGKTTFLKRLRELSPKRSVVLAPTGVAAINAEGQTIHSFFQLPFGPIVPGAERAGNARFRMSKEKKNLIRTLDLLVIDEISMVRCDLLDAIDAELRKYRQHGKPFGGVQLLLIGDLQQLAPVAKESEWQLLAPHYKTPYFFGSKALQQIKYVMVELKHIYRQQDEDFINLLGKIRNNMVDAETIERLNARYIPDFNPPADKDWIRLTTHNRMADEYNANMLAALDNQEMHFKAAIKGNFPESSYPAEEDLVLKIGAQVMFIKNDPGGAHEYYNGKIGIVEGIDEEGIAVFSKESGEHIVVPPVEWKNVKFALDEKTNEIKEEVDGIFLQYPLRLAWAITVHKSQGLTFDNAVLDVYDSFAHGQTYVALSRCRTLDGIVLARPFRTQSVIADSSVHAYIDKEQDKAKEVKEQLPRMMQEYYLALLDEAFSFSNLYSDAQYLTRILDEYLYTLYPDYLKLLKGTLPLIKKDLADVAETFQTQYRRMLLTSQNFMKDELLHQRIHAAAEYFLKKTHELLDPVIENCVLRIGNAQISKQYNNALEAFKLSYKLKVGVFARMADKPFSVKLYLSAKAKATLDDISIAKGSKSQKNNDLDAKTKEKAPKKKPAKEKTAKEKKPKIDTKAETMRLLKEGNSLKEIAAIRQLQTSTIETHLAHFVKIGELDINDFVSAEEQAAIRQVIQSFTQSYTLSDIKNRLPSEISYMAIKMVIAVMDK